MRYAYLDVARGVALVLMVVNHTARYWLAPELDASRLIYLTTSSAGPTFLFLVGFVLPLSYRHSAHPVRRAVQRAAGLAAAGYALNLVLAPEQPFLGSNVLHTIAAAVLLGAITQRWLARPLARYAVAAVGALGYAAFVIAFPALTVWVDAHPLVARLAFYDFPLWPWLGLVLLGQALGSAALAVPDDRARATFHGRLGLAAVVLAAGALVYEWWRPLVPAVGFSRDLLITNHWVPHGASVAWVLAWVFATIAGCFYLVDRRGVHLRPLVVLGRAALFLYLAHHVVVVTLVRRGLGVALHSWPRYWLANAVLLAVLIALAAGWLRLAGRRRAVLAAPADLSAAA
ncbi:MAG TPA: heparan-alpha-glucosaminide N-acetyltransferase domain-containing protein [Methylomirabilota bacterium]|nr:heparan-alpha-glucosaminide N-acetyltransferase domain-containing protein [Methylomirabilota bacterium]